MVQNWESKNLFWTASSYPGKQGKLPLSLEASRAILLPTKENHYIEIRLFEKENISVVKSSDLVNS